MSVGGKKVYYSNSGTSCQEAVTFQSLETLRLAKHPSVKENFIIISLAMMQGDGLEELLKPKDW